MHVRTRVLLLAFHPYERPLRRRMFPEAITPSLLFHPFACPAGSYPRVRNTAHEAEIPAEQGSSVNEKPPRFPRERLN